MLLSIKVTESYAELYEAYIKRKGIIFCVYNLFLYDVSEYSNNLSENEVQNRFTELVVSYIQMVFFFNRIFLFIYLLSPPPLPPAKTIARLSQRVWTTTL